MENRRRATILTTTAFAMLAAASFAQAGDSRDVVELPLTSARALSDTWDADAKAMTNPLPSPDTSDVTAEVGVGDLIPGVAKPRGKRRLVQSKSRSQTRAFGSFGIPYTATRVQLGNQSASGVRRRNHLSVTYPYRTIGRLDFITPNGPSFCSASLIRVSVIVTAAHCFQAFGSHPARYRNFRFRPGHYGAAGASARQIAPYGVWRTRLVTRAFSWANGTDVGSGAARDNDIAVFILAKDSRGRFAGQIVGYLGYGWNNYSFVADSKTGNLGMAAVSTLGYPGLLDGGRIMQRTDGPTYLTTVGGARQLMQGSNMTGGSSGGPWIVNFKSRNPVRTGGAVPGSQPGMAVVGVTSWGSADPNAPKDNYSSQFAQNSRYPLGSYGSYGAGNIGSLLNTLCTRPAPGGGTYQSQGYCN